MRSVFLEKKGNIFAAVVVVHSGNFSHLQEVPRVFFVNERGLTDGIRNCKECSALLSGGRWMMVEGEAGLVYEASLGQNVRRSAGLATSHRLEERFRPYVQLPTISSCQEDNNDHLPH